MPITIQEIIASDTISQFVDKTNFNFDQLLLNGGGPSGPVGPKGPTGPAGGRGPKGSTWYDDAATSNPGNTPNAVPPTATPLSGDYYLQFNGQVWEYNGTTWVITTVDLQGPAGPKGSGGGFSESTGAPIFNESNILYNGPIGLNDGANATNEGVPSIMIGGVTSQTPQLTGIPFTAAYIVPQAIVVGNPSTLTSLLIHQRDSNSRGIVFHGGDTGIFDKYEQTLPAKLSNISIGIDDKLMLNVPKNPTSPLSQTQMRGIELISESRSQYFRAGADILFQSGVEATSQFAGQHSNFEINVGSGSSSGDGNVFKTITQGTIGTTLLEAGVTTQITLVASQTIQKGNWQLQAGDIRMISSTAKDIALYAGRKLVLDTLQGASNGAIELASGSGGINANSEGVINISNAAVGSNSINIDSGDEVRISADSEILMDAQSNMSMTAGLGGSGDIDMAANGNITIDSKATGNIELLTNSKLRAYFDGGSGAVPSTYWGQIAIGGNYGVPNSITVPYRNPLIVIDSTRTFSSVTPVLPTLSIQLGVRPRSRGAALPTPNNLIDYNGGSEIMGTYLPLTADPYVAGKNRFQVENEGALHLRGGIVEAYDSVSGLNKTINPGSIWIYNEEPNGRNHPQTNKYLAGSIRLWSTPHADVPSTSGADVGIGDGITLGLNADLMAAQTNATIANTNAYNQGMLPVTGRVSLYGISDNAASLSGGWNQNTSIAVSANSELSNGAGYAGVNVGDKYRATQTFKVWGDYMGDQFVGGPGVAAGTGQAAGGGIISGVPGSGWNIEAINQQSILSGSTNKPEATVTVSNSFSPWIRQQGGNLQAGGQNVTEFAFRYQWTRVGRVVTGSGTIKQRVVGGGAGISPTTGIESHDAIWYSSGSNTDEFKNYVDIGPIPFPVQVGTGNSTYDSAIDYADGYGVNNYSVSGIAQGVIDYTTRSGASSGVDLYQSNGAAITSNFNLPGPPATGIVGVGGAISGDTAAAGASNTLAADTLSMGSDCMWIRMWPSNQGALSPPVISNGGVIPAWIKFTFSYELNDYAN